MTAERLIDLLAEKKLVSPDLIKGFRERVAHAEAPVSAEVFADRLVENDLLSRSLADSLLRQIQTETHHVDLASFPTPLPSAQQAPPKSAPKPPPIPRAPAPSASPLTSFSKTEQTEKLGQFKSKRLSGPKKPKNVWDTKLMLYGGASLLVLIVVGFALFGSLFRRNADALFERANAAHDKGVSSQAISDFSEFIAAYPTHSNAPRAKVRLALARIRLLADSGTDWSKTLEAAEQEITEVESIPIFFDESKQELSVLLPKIAQGLAAEAETKTSQLHIDRTEKTLLLIDRLLPPSLLPTEQLLSVRNQIARTKRTLLQGNSLRDLQSQFNEHLKQTPTTATIQEGYRLLDEFIRENPELNQNDNVVELFRQLADIESQVVVQKPLPSIDGLAETPVTLLPSLYNTQRKNNAEVSDKQVIFVKSDQMLFGLRAKTGEPVWRLPLQSRGTVQPIPTSSGADAFALLLDDQSGTVSLVSGGTGKIVQTMTIKEPCRFSEMITKNSLTLIALSSNAGDLALLSIDTAKESMMCKNVIRFPQPFSAASAIDPEKRCLYQLAERNTLYVVPYDEQNELRSEKATSVSVAHQKGTAGIAPVIFDSLLLLPRRTTVPSSQIDVFSIADIHENQREKRAVPLDSFSINGYWKSNAVKADAKLFFAMSTGEILAYQSVAAGDAAKKPLARIASDITSGGARYIASVGKSIWLADAHLSRLELQLAESRFVTKESLRQNIKTHALILNDGAVLFHVGGTNYPGGMTVTAVLPPPINNPTAKSEILWETEIAEPIISEPIVNDDAISVVTASGKRYVLSKDDLEKPFVGNPADTLLKNAFQHTSLGAIVPIADGYEAWVPLLTSQTSTTSNDGDKKQDYRLMMVFDPLASAATRFRSIVLPEAMSVLPVNLNGELLVPLASGQIALYNVKNGQPVTEAFRPPAPVSHRALWTAPVLVTNNQFVIADNRPDEQRQRFLYWVERAAGNPPSFVLKAKLAMDRQISAMGVYHENQLAVFDDAKNLVLVDTNSPTPLAVRKTLPLESRVVWGPHPFGKKLLFATDDDKIHCLSEDDALQSVTSEKPVGKPFRESDDTFWVNTVSGQCVLFDAKQMRSVEKVSALAKPTVGLTKFHSRFILLGSDGLMTTVE